MKICLDAGHGGADPGAILGKRYEKDDVLKLALAVKPLLEAQGIDVLLTRTDDKTVPTIAQRCQMANEAGCDYYLSLHRDAAGASAYGISLWVHSRAPASMVEKAQGILDALLEVTPTKNRGVNKGTPQGYQDFGVNSQTTMASALLELGFVTNAEDNRRLDEHFDAYAAAICKGLCAAVGKSYITPIDPPASELTPIMGESRATAGQMLAWLRAVNPEAPDYTQLYLDEGADEGVRGDIAFAQSCIETDFWRFGGDVRPSQNNFAGIGATGGGESGNSFATPQLGIRAQVQHLKCYASADPLNGECVDPRWGNWLRGKAPYVEWLGIPDNPSGIGWAGGKGYGAAILKVLSDILAMPAETPEQTDYKVLYERCKDRYDALCAEIIALGAKCGEK